MSECCPAQRAHPPLHGLHAGHGDTAQGTRPRVQGGVKPS